MASIPQVPEATHQESSSAGSMRGLRVHFGKERQPAGRSLYRAKTHIGEQQNLNPKPSDDLKDPLVRPPHFDSFKFSSTKLRS